MAALAVVGVLAAAGCSRSGADRVPEGGRPGRAPVAAGVQPSASSAQNPSTGTPSGGSAPEGEAFYDAPDPLPGDKPGGVVRERPFTGDEAVAGAAKEQLVMYRTTDPDGKPVAATGTIAVPNGTAPEGGWPVVAWDHGTTGIGSKCAPSRGPGPKSQGAADLLAELVKRGYAVVQPDYVGMGVNGVRHPYMNGQSAAYATFDLVRAARELDSNIGKTWFVAGHSQGGHAALWSGHYAAEYAPELELKGAVAIAPANGFNLMPGLAAQGDAQAAQYSGILLLLVNGAAVSNPEVKPEGIFTEAGLAVAQKAWDACAGDPAAQGQLPSGPDLIKPGADLAPLTQELIKNAPYAAKPTVPVFMPQGGQDPLAAMNKPLADTLCGNGVSVEYKVYPDLAHDPKEVSDTATDVVAWIEARKAGTPVEGACAAS